MRTPPPLALPFFPAVFSVKMRRSARGFNQKSLADRTSAEVFLSYHEHGQDARPLAPGKRGFSPGGAEGREGKVQGARRHGQDAMGTPLRAAPFPVLPPSAPKRRRESFAFPAPTPHSPLPPYGSFKHFLTDTLPVPVSHTAPSARRSPS